MRREGCDNAGIIVGGFRNFRISSPSSSSSFFLLVNLLYFLVLVNLLYFLVLSDRGRGACGDHLVVSLVV